MALIMTRVHGTTVVAQQPAGGRLLQVDGTPYTDVTGMPFGWGKTFRIASGRGTWFHLAIPSVAHLQDRPLFLDQFFVFFSTEIRDGRFTTQISDVHAWDGSARIFTFRPPQPYAGDWSAPREVTDSSGFTFGNTWLPRRRETLERFPMNTALGISLNAGSILEGNITFHSAGAGFVDAPR